MGEWCQWVEYTNRQIMKENQRLVVIVAEHSFSHECVHELCVPLRHKRMLYIKAFKISQSISNFVLDVMGFLRYHT